MWHRPEAGTLVKYQPQVSRTLGLEKVKKVRMRDVVGRWRIIEMEQWDQEYVDELGPGFLKLERAGTGSLQFGVVQAGVDYRMEERTGNPVLEFSFEGFARWKGYADVAGRTSTERQ